MMTQSKTIELLRCVSRSTEQLTHPDGWSTVLPDMAAYLSGVLEAQKAFLLHSPLSLADSPRAEGWCVEELTGEATRPYTLPMRERFENRLVNGCLLVLSGATGRPDHKAALCRMGVSSALLAPIFCEDELWGALGVGSEDPERIWSTSEQDSLVALANCLSAALQANYYKNLARRFEALCMRDEGTAILNRRGLIRAVGALQPDEKSPPAYAVAFIDVDSFKAVNDRYGHAVGDRVLSAICAEVRGAVRTEDLVGRWGGDEIVAILPGATANDAETMMARLCDTIEALRLPELHADHRLRVSVGVAASPEDGMTFVELLQTADARLYAAKANGGSTVRVGPPASDSTARCAAASAH